MSVSSETKPRRRGNLLRLVLEPSWVLLSFVTIAVLVSLLASSLAPVGQFLETTLGALVLGGVVYALVLGVVLLPILKRGRVYLRGLLGIDKKPGRDILWRPLVLWLCYMVTTVMVMAVIGGLFYYLDWNWIDFDQKQETGFSGISLPYEYILAFFALVVLPPIAEELLFRGYLFGRLRERFRFWPATIVTSLIFALVHGQWNVGIDTAVLSVFLCYLRERTGSVWASMVLHAIKNGFAYFFLFIAPLLGWQLVQ